MIDQIGEQGVSSLYVELLFVLSLGDRDPATAVSDQQPVGNGQQHRDD